MLINQNLSVVIDNERSSMSNQDSLEGNLCQQTSNEVDLQVKDQNIATDTASINASSLVLAMHNKKSITLNMDALIGLAITTAIFRSDYDNQTDVADLEIDDAWDTIEELALDYLKWVGVDISNLSIDKYDIAQSFCGMDSDELNDLITDLH
jgi:hypothetical protein